jgi:hypothetical protein
VLKISILKFIIFGNANVLKNEITKEYASTFPYSVHLHNLQLLDSSNYTGCIKKTEQILNRSQFRQTACGTKFLLNIDSLSTRCYEDGTRCYMDQRQYSPPNKEKGDHSKEIESKSHSTPARKIQENAFRSQTTTSRKP